MEAGASASRSGDVEMSMKTLRRIGAGVVFHGLGDACYGIGSATGGKTDVRNIDAASGLPSDQVNPTVGLNDTRSKNGDLVWGMAFSK